MTKKDSYYFDQRYLNTKDPWGIFCRPSQIYRLQVYLDVIDKYLPNRIDNVLEIACADGFFTEMIIPKAKHIVATDYSRILIELAKRRVHSNIVLFDVVTLPKLDFKERMFDLVTAFEVILYFPDSDQREIFNKVWLILKERGYFVFTEEFKKIDELIDHNKFEIKSIRNVYANFLNLQDYIYNIARRVDFLIEFIRKYKNNDCYKQFGEKYKNMAVIHFLIMFRPFLYLMLPFLYFSWILMYFVYSSKVLHQLLLSISKLFNYKVGRQIIVLQKL